MQPFVVIYFVAPCGLRAPYYAPDRGVARIDPMKVFEFGPAVYLGQVPVASSVSLRFG